MTPSVPTSGLSKTLPNIAVIDLNELAARICEISIGIKRPEGISGADWMEAIHQGDPLTASGFQAAALAALEFISESMNAADPGSFEIKHIEAATGGIQ